MTGLVLSIAVLATGSILPNVEAMKPTKDPATGIKIQCKIPKSGIAVLSCILSAKEGIDFFILLTPTSGPFNLDRDCDKRTESKLVLQNGEFFYTVTKCGGGESVFKVTVVGSQIHSVELVP